MALPVSLRSVVDELDGLTDESAAYLNRETGELYTVRDEEAALIEDGVDCSDLPDWLEDVLPKVSEVLQSDSWLALPARFEIHEWSIMDEFARSIEDANLRDELLGAIRGRGAFRHFKDVLYGHGIQQDWYRHRTEVLGRIAVEWLEEHQLAFSLDLKPASGQ